MKGLRSSLTLVIFLSKKKKKRVESTVEPPRCTQIQSRGYDDWGNLGQIEDLYSSKSHFKKKKKTLFNKTFELCFMSPVKQDHLLQEWYELTAMETALVTAPTYPRKNLENGAGYSGN